MHRQNKFFLTLFLLAFVSSKAQYSDSVKYYAGYTSAGTFNNTNKSSYYLLNNQLKFGARKKILSLNSSTKWLFGRQEGELTNNDIVSSLDANLHKTFPHFYYWALLNYNQSYSLRVNNQAQAGVGVAYNIVDTKQLIVNLSDGILYDYSDLNTTDSTREIYGTPRNSFRFQVKWNFKNKIVFNGNSFLQNSLTDGNDYIVKTDLNLSVKIRKWLSITSSFIYNQITRTRSENLFISYGLTLEKYF
jgi:hypothetical protein